MFECLTVDVESLTGAELPDHVLALESLRQRVDVAQVRAAARCDAAQVWAADGALSGTAWLRHHTGMPARVARARLRMATQLRSMPATAAAFAAGTIRVEHVELLCRTRTDANAPVFDRDEELLVDIAHDMDADEFSKVLRYWRACADAVGFTDDADAKVAARKAAVSETLDGMVKVDAWLDPESGGLFKAVFDEIDDEMYRADRRDWDLHRIMARTIAQRRADALVELARRAALWTDETDDHDHDGSEDDRASNTDTCTCTCDSHEPPDSPVASETEPNSTTQTDLDTTTHPGPADAGTGTDTGTDLGLRLDMASGPAAATETTSSPDAETDPRSCSCSGTGRRPRSRTRTRPRPGRRRPAISVIVNLTTLRARTGGIAHLDNGATISGEAARRLACDAAISRIITNGRSEPIDLGRTTATTTPAQRRGAAARDGTCTFPSCDRPARDCELHHLIHYARGSHTGGPTDLDNLGHLCPRHHHLVHEGGFTMAYNPTTDQIETRRPDGTLLPTRPRATPLNPTGHHPRTAALPFTTSTPHDHHDSPDHPLDRLDGYPARTNNPTHTRQTRNHHRDIASEACRLAFLERRRAALRLEAGW